MVDVVLRFALNKISAFLNEHGSLVGGLADDVILIRDEFRHMKAFLDKMENLQQEIDDPQLTEWSRQVREVSYDVEDIIDEFCYLSAGRRAPRFLGSAWRLTKTIPARHQLASKLQSVKARIVNISESHLRYESPYINSLSLSQVSERIAADNTWRGCRNDDALLAEETQLVGMEEPKKQLISHLIDDVDSQLKVIAVVGMGGLGKTTLAKLVYKDAAVKKTGHFRIRAWVSVSQNCNSLNLLKGLIQQLMDQFNEPTPSRMESMDSYALKSVLKDILRRGRYVVVFDDVWDAEFWDAFKFVFPKNAYSGNRVMFTTRIEDVAIASTVESQGFVHVMRFLNFQDSWTLLCRKVFKDNHCPGHLNIIARSILEKCKGLPLSILAIGGLLASRDTSRIEEWELVQKRLENHEFEGNMDRVKKIISLSYNDLPFKLRTCLLYTCILSPGYNISSHRLIQLLVAEGFVEKRDGETREETAWYYIKELANRSLIQLNKVRYNRFYDSVVIHDLLHEFIASKSSEQNMATTVSTTDWPSRNVIRRLVFSHNLLEIGRPESEYCTIKCRSIINFGRKMPVSKEVLAKLLTSKLLAVLDLRGMDLEEIPQDIFKLFQLKVLAISGKRITRVPKSIKRLHNLQCFNLTETSVKELGMGIQKLQKLHHLEVSHKAADSPGGHLGVKGFKASCEIGKLLMLQTLYAIDASKSQSRNSRIVNELGKLSRLRELIIMNLRKEDGNELCSSLGKLNHLRELAVASSVENGEAISLDLNHPISVSSLQSLRQLQLYGHLEKIPSWIKNLRELERIRLSLSDLVDDPLETLQCLPNLFQVSLIRAYQGEYLCFKSGCFLKLRLMSIGYMMGLRWMTIEKGAMPGIEDLIMDKFPLLEDLPNGIEHLSQLQRLGMWNVNSQLINKLENVADFDGWMQISHIPEVAIGSQIDGKWNWLTRKS